MKGTAAVGLAVTFLVIATAQALNSPGAPADHFLTHRTKTTKGTTKFVVRKNVRLTVITVGGLAARAEAADRNVIKGAFEALFQRPF